MSADEDVPVREVREYLEGLGSIYRPVYKDKRTGERKLTSTWFAEYMHRGKRHREAVRSDKRDDVVALLQKRQGERQAGRPVGRDIEKTTYADLSKLLVTDYKVNGKKSLERVETSLGHLDDYFDGDRAVDITADRIMSYVESRQAEGAANATINRELAALKRMFRLGERVSKVAQRPYIAMLREDNARRGFFEAAQFSAVLSHLPEDLRPVAEVAYVTGWRVRSELLTRHWSHVDLGAGWLRLEPGETKNRKGRQFPLTPRLKTVLKQQRERTTALEREKGRIIPSVFHRGGEPIKTFYGAWKRACREAGVPGRILHDFRRTAVRNLERAGVPRSSAMAMVGHQTEAIYRRYAITDEAMLKEAAAKLAESETQFAGEDATAING